MDTDETPADAATPPTSNDTDVNMQDAKASPETPGVENGIPEAGDKSVQIDSDSSKVGTIERNIQVYAQYVIYLLYAIVELFYSIFLACYGF